MKYTPCNNRIIIKVLKASFEQTAGGLLIDGDDLKTESKNNLIRATIVRVGHACTFFTPEQEGLVVLIHEVAGVPMHGVDSDYKILREDDIWAFSEEQPSEIITLADAMKESPFAKEVNHQESK